MLDCVGIINPGDWVLEPSAGKGDIVDAICKHYPRETIALDVLEINHTLCGILGTKGYNVHRFDFLEWKGTKYDRIVMNPPFENLQDIEHVRHAYDLLKPGGRLVSVMSTGPFHRSDRKATEFRTWLDGLSNYSVDDLPSDAFKDSFRSTGVSTKLVVIHKC
jgi:cyclopropane fatty-acyl-phospholipid synthase-like methyltransferase